MNVQEAIQTCVEHYRNAGELRPSLTTTRCFINDLTADNPRIYREGYNQERAWKKVRKLLGTPVQT